ncbi:MULTISPECIES: helix-turn-helix domain-containing protein [unclassified Mycolicibacterium]|uniref:helix-turn-helix domain-containing protein n=1 Tax=unclassified Mycolicibacterium TaxID=2636767 RepID=UPI00192E6226|nr:MULTISPECIES: helix-turn-helix domain-containing protein [unclassified Mycolicibacterium]
MSKARVVVLEVVSGHLSISAAARAYSMSRQHIYRLLKRYRDDGLDAGPVTLQSHLAGQQLPVPSTSTIRRILHHHGLITPQPRKRPNRSFRRFAAEQRRRMLAIGLHALAPGRRHRHRDPQLAR